MGGRFDFHRLTRKSHVLLCNVPTIRGDVIFTLSADTTSYFYYPRFSLGVIVYQGVATYLPEDCCFSGIASIKKTKLGVLI